LLHYRGISTDEFDDGGNVFPLLKDLSDDELEYCWHWIDHYLHYESGCTVIGTHKDFWEVNKYEDLFRTGKDSNLKEKI